MSFARGFTTGFLGGAIKDKELRDAQKAEITKLVGVDFYTKTLPNIVEAEAEREKNYNILRSSYDENFANVADASGFTTDKMSMDRLFAQLKEKNINKDKLKNAVFKDDYNTRFEQRGKTFEEKYAPIFNQLGIKEIGGLGPYTVNALLKGDKEEQPSASTISETPVQYSSTNLSDYLTPLGISVALDANKFAKAAESVRGFDELITIDPITQTASVNLGNRANEFTALRNITQEVLPQFGTGKEGEASLPAAISFANKVLDERVNQVIFGKQTETGRIPGLVQLKQDPKNPNNMIASNNFSGGFLNKFPTALEQKTYLAQGIRDLPSLEEQRYFAETFPEGVKFSDGTDAKIFLLQITGLAK